MTLFQGGTKLPAWPKVSPIDGMSLFQPNTTISSEGRTTIVSRPHGNGRPHQPSWTATNSSIDVNRKSRLFFRKSGFTKPSLTVTSTSQLSQIISGQLTDILETLNSNKDMFAIGQASIWQAISDISEGTDTKCDLSSLEMGQTQMQTIILDGQTTIANSISSDLNNVKDMILKTTYADIASVLIEVNTAKTIVLGRQDTIDTNIYRVSKELATSQTMILDGQTAMTDALSSYLSTAKDMIIAG